MKIGGKTRRCEFGSIDPYGWPEIKGTVLLLGPSILMELER